MTESCDLKYLIELFDDTNELVVNAVNSNMFNRGISIINDLTDYYHKEKSEETKWYIAQKIHYLSSEFTIQEFASFALNEDVDLEKGFYLISKLLNQDLDEVYFRDIITVLSEDIFQEINEKKTAFEKVNIFNHIFYKRLLFKCLQSSPTRESTNIIVSVMSSRNGSPIVIALIYFLIARRAGLPIFPMISPIGLVPAYVEDDQTLFYIDINREGEIFLQERLGEDFDSFQIREDRVLIVIYIELLSQMYFMKGDMDKYNLLNRVLDIFPDERFLEREE